MGHTPDNSVFIAGLHLHEAHDPEFDLDAVLHPGRVFAHPSQVVQHPGLSLQEKRAILASWASDACTVESTPALRRGPGGGKPVSFDEVMDALRTLDGTDRDTWNRSTEPRLGRAGRRAPLPFGRGRIWRGGSGSEQGPGSGAASLG